MKYLKMLGLAAVAAMALMAFGAGSASATVLCSESITTGCGTAGKDLASGTVIEAKLLGTAVLKTKEGTVLDECEGSKIKGKTSTTGGSGSTVKGPVEELAWGTCTKTTHTLTNGELEIHHITGTDNGTLTVVGTEVTVNTIFGSCVFTASDIGTLVGGSPAKISMVNQVVKRLSGLCPSEVLWTAEWEVTSPKPLWVAAS